jgi:hypothetical protein
MPHRRRTDHPKDMPMEPLSATHTLVLVIHLLLFAYWLGGDIGVFYSSKFVVRGDLSRETRLTVAKIFINLDLVPRICMALMLTVGGILSEFVGVPHPTWQMIGIVLLGPVWLSMVLFLHFREGTEAAKKIARVDYWFRWLLIVAIIASVAWSWSTGRLADAPWLALKILLFAFLIFCGLMIRVMIKPFGPAFHRLVTGEATAEDDAVMAASLARAKPWVLAIWAGLVIEAVLGAGKPFGG